MIAANRYRAASASVSFGITVNTSPTTPRSANSKMGAFTSLLLATITPALDIPTLCWIAPEMPQATYSLGDTVLPVCPTCIEYEVQPASTTARVAATSPPSALASCSTTGMFSGPPMPRPNATSTPASVMSTPPVSACPRPAMRAADDHACTVTATRSTGAVAVPVGSDANAFARPRMIAGDDAKVDSTITVSPSAGRTATVTPAPNSTASTSRACGSSASTSGCGSPASAASSATSTLDAPYAPNPPAQASSMPEPPTNAATSPPSDAAFASTPRLFGLNAPSS